MEEVIIIENFSDHKLIKSKSRCTDCNSSLYRQFNDGTITCVKCLKIIRHPDKAPGKK